MVPASYLPPYLKNVATTITEEVGYVSVVCRPGPYSPQDAQPMLTYLGRLLHLRQWSRVLLDQQHLPPLKEAERAQFTTYWLQLARQLERQLFIAYLPPLNVIARLAATQARFELRDSSITFCSFDTLRAAVAWLETTTN